MQHPRTERALKAVETLSKEGVIKTQKELCKNIDYDYSNYSQIKNGKRDLPEKNIDNLIKAYNVNPDYIRFGRAPVFLEQAAKNENKPEGSSENELFRLRVEVDLLWSALKELQKDTTINGANIEELKTVTFKKRVAKKQDK